MTMSATLILSAPVDEQREARAAALGPDALAAELTATLQAGEVLPRWARARAQLAAAHSTLAAQDQRLQRLAAHRAALEVRVEPALLAGSDTTPIFAELAATDRDVAQATAAHASAARQVELLLRPASTLHLQATNEVAWRHGQVHQVVADRLDGRLAEVRGLLAEALPRTLLDDVTDGATVGRRLARGRELLAEAALFGRAVALLAAQADAVFRSVLEQLVGPAPTPPDAQQ
jgi:hypothetical protein